MIRTRFPMSALVRGTALSRLAVATVAAAALSILSDSVRADEPSPDPGRGVVSLTFDDGFAATYHQVAPILARHGLAGTVYVTTDFVGQANRVTWEELRDLQDRFGWEIGSHTMSHPELPTISTEAIRREVAESKCKLEAQGLRIDSFASPFGAYDDRVLVEVVRGYSAHRGFWERASLNHWPYEPLRLRVQSVEHNTPVERVINWIDAAVTNEDWLVLVLHEFAAEPCANYEYCTTYADLELIVDYLEERAVRVATIREVILEDDSDWLLNETFADELSARGWSGDTDATVQRHDGGRGAHPDPLWSVQLNPSSQRPARLVAPPLPVHTGQIYRIDAFVDRRSLVDGDMSVHVEEFGATGSSLGTRVVGWVAAPVVLCRWSYSPASPEVAAVRLSVVARGSQGQSVYVDNLRVAEVNEALGVTETR